LGVEEAAEAVEGAGLAEYDEGFEQGWGGGLAGEDGAQEHDVVLDGPVLFGAEFFERGVEVFLGERGGFEEGELLGGECEGLLQRVLLGEEDLWRGHDIVLEEEVGHLAELGEGFDAGLDEGGDAAEVIVRKDGGAQGGEEGLGGESAEVLSVEPLELGEIEDRAAKGDALEVEFFEHLWEGEMSPCLMLMPLETISSSVGWAMPPPMRPRKLSMAWGRKPDSR